MKLKSVPMSSNNTIIIKFGDIEIRNLEAYGYIKGYIEAIDVSNPNIKNSGNRKRQSLETKRIFQYLLSKYTLYTRAEIGYYTGFLDHASVGASLIKLEQDCSTYPKERERFNKIFSDFESTYFAKIFMKP